MPRICLSYRRADSGAITGRIFDRLVAHFGADLVFMDIDNIPVGIDFREHIDKVLGVGAILVAVIGRQWLGPMADGHFRIFSATDPVRVEIQTALQRKMLMIPVLIDGATMPTDAELPNEIKEFSFRNAIEIDSGRDFGVHVGRLIRAAEQMINSGRDAAPSESDDMTAALPATILAGHGRDAQGTTAIVSTLLAYFTASVVMLLCADYVINLKFDLPTVYLRIATLVISLALGVALSRWPGLGWLLVGTVSVAVGIVAIAGMLTLVSLIGGTSIFPKTEVEWQEAGEYFFTIVLGVIAGSLAGYWLQLLKARILRQ